jgi:hypothetical protein
MLMRAWSTECKEGEISIILHGDSGSSLLQKSYRLSMFLMPGLSKLEEAHPFGLLLCNGKILKWELIVWNN